MSLSVALIDQEGNFVYSGNITHNLGPMANQAGLYQVLWRPEDLGGKSSAPFDIANGSVYAHQLEEDMAKGLFELVSRPTFFKAFDSQNGWGIYVDFVPFVSAYYEAICSNPNARVYVSR